jgi:hypothetical protein
MTISGVKRFQLKKLFRKNYGSFGAWLSPEKCFLETIVSYLVHIENVK